MSLGTGAPTRSLCVTFCLTQQACRIGRLKQTPCGRILSPASASAIRAKAWFWLQRVIERVTGEPLESVMDRLVLAPLGMNHSALIWRTAFEVDYADPHDAALVPGVKSKPTEAKSASTLHTTARDYALFLRAALSGRHLSPTIARLWLEPQVWVRQRCVECLTPYPNRICMWRGDWGGVWSPVPKHSSSGETTGDSRPSRLARAEIGRQSSSSQTAGTTCRLCPN
jgi:CubicO group peptidase (beta-lactamase class C family)